MKNEYQEIDRLITDALTSEEAAYYEELQEQNLEDQVIGLFRGKMMWFAVVVTIVSLIAFIISIYAVVQFLQTDDIILTIRWGALFFITMMMVSMLKLYTWNQMDKNALIREIKRLELQIALLARKEEEKN